MRKFTTLAVALFVTLGVLAGLSQANTPDAAVKKVMKGAMKSGLCKTVASGKGTDDQKKELLAMFEDLAKATPPKGEASSWEEKTKALVDAAHGVVKGEEGATKALGKAANCKACHDVHKGE